MPWAEIFRPKYRRDGLRYSSDMTDEEWQIVKPLLPPPCKRGRSRTVSPREVVNAVLSIATTGCQWRLLPKDFPPRSTGQGDFYCWRDHGTLESINFALVSAAVSVVPEPRFVSRLGMA